VLGVHGLPLPADPTMLPSVVLGHPLHQLLEDAHLPPALEAFMDHAGGDPKPMAMDGLPLASRPKDVPIWALMTARSDALGLPPFALLLLFSF
jgi:hypothetical protein